MPTARRYQIFPEITPYYHCISRCVRRAWLCGKDPVSGRNFDHRKAWIESRILLLGEVFAIDIDAYAVMSSHYHVVLCIDEKKSDSWTAQEVIRRWGQICRLSLLAKAFLENKVTAALDLEVMFKQVECWRSRLKSISWFMRYVNEPLARMANAQDGCTGRFWEGRFKSQALLDESALVACMVYVDLNPVRAGITNRPELGRYTSVCRRVTKRENGLAPFAGESAIGFTGEELPIDRRSYLKLIDWSGRIVVEGKPGKIPQSLAPILQRLGGAKAWLANVTDRPSHGIFFGSVAVLRSICMAAGRSWVWGCSKARETASPQTSPILTA